MGWRGSRRRTVLLVVPLVVGAGFAAARVSERSGTTDNTAVVAESTSVAPAVTTTVPDRPVDPDDVSVLWLQLDEAPLWPLLRTDGTINAQRFPGFAALAGASTWFRNTVSVSNYTVSAVPAGVTGRWSRPKALPVAGNYPQNLFTLMNGHRALDVSESVAALCPRDVCTSAVVPKVRNSVSAWEKGGARTQVGYATGMIERASASVSPTLHYAHVLLPHRPWELTPDMRTTRFVGTDPRAATVEDRVRDEYQAFLAQYVATDRIILQLVESLKASANWDRTMIVVTSDHGIAFEPGESKRKEINPKRIDTLDEIYRVPLFVKFPGQAAPVVSDCAARTFDVLPMVSEATGVALTWDIDGESQRTHCRTESSRRITWYNGEAQLAGGFTETLSRVRRFTRWVDADGTVDDIAKPTGDEQWFDVTLPVSPSVEKQVTKWTLRDAPLFNGITGDTFAKIPLQFDGTFTATGSVTKDAVGLVVLDGRVVAVVPEIAGEGVGAHPYRSMILPSALTAGDHAPELWIGRGSPSAPVLTRVGAPS